MEGRNTSQDPDYVGPVGHEKKLHKTHFGAPDVRLMKRRGGETKRINGTLYVWSGGRWKVKDVQDSIRPNV